MKKSLIALAALATVATAAQAQSSVTLYGIMDAGIVTGKNKDSGTLTKVESGALSTSRFGFKGTEDLGGGLSASFTLESEVSIDTGAQPSTATSTSQGTSTASLFNRLSFVQLESKDFGAIQLGRMNRLEYDAVIANDAFGGSNFGSSVRSGYISGGIYLSDARYPNAVVLRSPSLGGLKLAYQRQMGEVAGDNSAWSSDSVSADFSYGKLRVIATYADNKQANGDDFTKVTTVGGSYDFGVAKVFAQYMDRDNAGAQPTTKVYSTGIQVPVSAKVTLLANYVNIKDQGSTSAATATSGKDASVATVGATYAFSKRTTGYAFYGQANNETTGAAYVSNLLASAVAGKDQTAATVGIRHTF